MHHSRYKTEKKIPGGFASCTPQKQFLWSALSHSTPQKNFLGGFAPLHPPVSIVKVHYHIPYKLIYYYALRVSLDQLYSNSSVRAKLNIFCKGNRIKAPSGRGGKESKVPEEYTPLSEI